MDRVGLTPIPPFFLLYARFLLLLSITSRLISTPFCYLSPFVSLNPVLKNHSRQLYRIRL